MKTIILTGGGTAGHVMPHLALLNDIKKHFSNVYYIGTNGIEKQLIEKTDIPFYEIEACKFIRSVSAKNLLIPFKLLKSVDDAYNILKKLKPNVVFSKGGYVGLPVTLAAHKLKIPVVIHESDLSLGLANKIASKFSKHVLTSFEPPSRIKNGVWAGPPVREDIFIKNRKNALEKFGFKGDKPILLITGGSKGAKYLNGIVLEVLNGLLNTFDVIHVTGKGNLSNVNKKGYYQVEFIDMHLAYSACDLCLSRAGSNTAFELVLLKIPSLLVPLPKGNSRGDQIENAKYFNSLGLCDYALQEELTSENLLKKLKSVYLKRNELESKLKASNLKIGNKNIIEILNKY